jgi:hypothetical protein
VAKTKPDPSKLYRPLQPVALLDSTVLNPGSRLRGDDPLVIEHFTPFIEADAADSE